MRPDLPTISNVTDGPVAKHEYKERLQWVDCGGGTHKMLLGLMTFSFLTAAGRLAGMCCDALISQRLLPVEGIPPYITLGAVCLCQ